MVILSEHASLLVSETEPARSSDQCSRTRLAASARTSDWADWVGHSVGSSEHSGGSSARCHRRPSASKLNIDSFGLTRIFPLLFLFMLLLLRDLFFFPNFEHVDARVR